MDISLAVQLGELLRQRGLTLAVAESCTGGLIGDRVTNVAGSSDYFLGGIVSYADDVKINQLGVSEETLKEHGAVSAQTVKEMAHCVRQVMGSNIGLSVSGIAGPGGGTAEKPVGLVWFGLATVDGVWTHEKRFQGDRVEVKTQAAAEAQRFLLSYLQGQLYGRN